MSYYYYEGPWRGESDLSNKARALDDYLCGVNFDNFEELEKALEDTSFRRKLCKAYVEDKYTFLGKFDHDDFIDMQESKEGWVDELKALKTSFTAYKRAVKEWKKTHSSWWGDDCNMSQYLQNTIDQADGKVIGAFYQQFCEPDIADFDDWDPDFLH